MKLNIYKLSLLVVCLGSFTFSCKKDFGDINTSEKIVDQPDIKFLLSYSQDRIVSYQGTEWIWESLEQIFRYTQHMTASPFEISNNVNSRYAAYYRDILPNLFEIRRQIDAKSDKERYQKAAAVTYILQVMHGLKVTDMNGSIPYTEAIKGRYESFYNPRYDDQKTLLDTWLQELDNSITVLSDNSLLNQEGYGTADLYYQGDYVKWTQLANTLKLRIAVRYENQDSEKARTIFQSVMSHPIGPIGSEDAQVEYMNGNSIPFNPTDLDYRSRRYGTSSLVNFMKRTGDPRLPVYFEPNDLTGSYRDSLSKYQVTLPAFINPADPLIMYQGGPADWTTNPTVAAYMSGSFAVGPLRYNLISPVNHLFFSLKMQVLVTYAETCFYIAEFIQKGYQGGVNTRGTAKDWYERGISSSINTMNTIARESGSSTAYSNNADGQALINSYINRPDVLLNGQNDLERIYIQQYLNFYRLPNEAFVFTRRTGYPKNGSAYYGRETFNEVIPRRFWLDDPGEVNRTNWTQALQEEGFTPGSRTLEDLNKQRIWYDKTAPEFGAGL